MAVLRQGLVLGGVMGLVFSSMDAGMTPGAMGSGVQHMTMREMAKDTWMRMKTHGKSFGAIGFMFAGSECLIASVSDRR